PGRPLAPHPSRTLPSTHFPDPSALLTSLTRHIMFSALDIPNGLIILCRLLLKSIPIFIKLSLKSVVSVVNSCAPSCILQYCEDLLIASPNKVHDVPTPNSTFKAIDDCGSQTESPQSSDKFI